MAKTSANGTQLEYEVIGAEGGIPLLFINGFGSQMVSWPRQFFETLADAGMRVVRFDNRDVGLSQKWDGVVPDIRAVMKTMREGGRPEVPYTLNEMAADAAGLLDALEIDTAHISGCSMGGMIAQLVALDHPEKARSLISIFSTTSDPSLPRSSKEAAEALTSRPASNDRDTVIAHAVKNRRAYASTAWAFDEAYWSEIAGRVYDRAFYPEGAIRHYAAIMASPARTERLKSLKLPALVLHGSSDTLIRPEAGRHTAQCIAGSEYREINGWGHDMPLAAVPIVAGLIVPFVRKVEAERKAAAA